MVQIVPTILVHTFKEFEAAVKKIEPHFHLAQIDVMDGTFVPNTTFADFKQIAKINTPLEYELHLMVEEPLDYIQDSRFKIQDSSIVRILFHFEATKKIEATIQYIRELKKQVGLAINPETEVSQIEKYLPKLDVIMVMGVHPGFAGQKFIPQTVDKVRALRKYNSQIAISVDGGIDNMSAPQLIKAGATILSVNTFLYKGDVVKQRDALL